LSIEKNKEIVKQYFHAVNTKNWDLVEKFLHEEYASHSTPMQDYVREITKTGVNPFVEFFRLLGYDDEMVGEVKNIVLAIKDKQSGIEYMKWLSQYISNIKILDMIAEGNRVWVYVNSEFLSHREHIINHSGHDQITFKDSKIIILHGAGRYLGSLMQIGKIIMANNNKEEIEKYLQGLRNLGILPTKIEN
jgi:predicted SnoaL-like aldol condensation-catalyzing enzyme